MVALTVLLLAPPAVRAAVYSWNVLSGDWSAALSWTGGTTLPASGDTAYVANGGTATVDTTGPTCNTLFLGGTGGGAVLMTTGSFAATTEHIGSYGSGTFTQSGGTNTAGTLDFSEGSSGNGVYNLAGGTLIASAIADPNNESACLNLGGGTLQAGASFSTSYWMNFTLPSGGVNATVNTAGYALTLAGTISGPGGLIKAGGGTLTLGTAGFSPNIYAGTTLISGGVLALGNSAALQESTLDASGAGTLSFGSLGAAPLGGLTGPGFISLTNATGGTVATTSAKPALGIYGNGRAVFYDASGYNWPTTNSTGSPFTLSGATAAALNVPLPASGATSATNYLRSGSGSVAAGQLV
jgi:autotransporter-associated beta strand protein